MNFSSDLLFEKYSLVRENDKENIMAGLETVGKEIEILNLFKYLTGFGLITTNKDRPLNYYIQKYENESLELFIWNEEMGSREANSFRDTISQDEVNEIAFSQLVKWFDQNTDLKQQICPNVTLDDLEKLIFSENISLNENDKEDIMSGLSDMEDRFKKEAEVLKNKTKIIDHFNIVYGAPLTYEHKFVLDVFKKLGIKEEEAKKINLSEILLNSEDVGTEIENSIQGFEDPNLIFSPGQVFWFKLEQIIKAINEGSLEQQYYYYNGRAEYWDIGSGPDQGMNINESLLKESSDKENIMAGLEDIEAKDLYRAILVNDYYSVLLDKRAVYFNKNRELRASDSFWDNIYIVGYQPGTMFWPAVGNNIEVDNENIRYFLKLSIRQPAASDVYSDTKVITIMELKEPDDIKKAEQIARSKWNERLEKNSNLNENQEEKQNIMAGLDEIQKYEIPIIAMQAALEVSFAKFLKEVINFAKVADELQSKNFEAGVQYKKGLRDHIENTYNNPDLISLFQTTLSLASSLIKIPAKDRRLIRVKKYLENKESIALLYYNRVLRNIQGLQENDNKDDILAGLDILSTDLDQPITRENIIKLGFVRVPGLFSNMFWIPDDANKIRLVHIGPRTGYWANRLVTVNAIAQGWNLMYPSSSEDTAPTYDGLRYELVTTLRELQSKYYEILSKHSDI